MVSELCIGQSKVETTGADSQGINWREKRKCPTHTNTPYILHLQILLHSWHKITMVKNPRSWQISIKVRNYILWSHKRPFQIYFNPMSIDTANWLRDSCRSTATASKLQGSDDTTELYYFIIIRFHDIITTSVYVMDLPYCIDMR